MTVDDSVDETGKPKRISKSRSKSHHPSSGNQKRKQRSHHHHHALRGWRPRKNLVTLERRLGFRFDSRDLLIKALTPVARRTSDTYQLLEYFGDAALRYLIPRLLRERYPNSSHGELSRMYSLLTRNTNLAFMAYRLRLPYYIRFNSRPSVNRKLLADVVEALIGAVDQVGGIPAARKVCQRLFRVDIELARFHEPQDTLLRLLEAPHALERMRRESPPESVWQQVKSDKPKVSYQLHVINKPWGKLGHVSVLRLNGVIIVKNGEGYDAESANNNAAALALLRLYPKRYPINGPGLSWKISDR